MDFEQAFNVVNSVFLEAFGRPLAYLEIELLKGAWYDRTYEQISDATGYSVNYLQRDIGPKFWKQISDAFGQKLNKNNIRPILGQRAIQQVEKIGTTVEWEKKGSSSPAMSTMSSHTDLGEIIDVSTFYGRQKELDLLAQWILHDRCRIVELLGMGGMGKSTLAAKIVHQFEDQFEYVIWRSLRNAPPLDVFLSELIAFLSNQQESEADVRRLLYYLRNARCLIIMDNLETLMQQEKAGQFQGPYRGYGELLRQLGETAHKSCLVITSREKPAEVAALEGVVSAVRTIALPGLQDEALQLFADKGLFGPPEDQQQLINSYSGNPLALKIVATSIQDLFDGDIHQFLQQDTVLFNGVRRLIDQQFNRLTPLEQSVMFWLAINREWTPVAELQEDIQPRVQRGKLLETLEALTWRHLIERRAGTYTQQPVVMEYMTDRLIQRVVEELTSVKTGHSFLEEEEEPLLFHSYALMKTTVKDYIRNSQERLILQPIGEQLKLAYNKPKALEKQISQILTWLRRSAPDVAGYGCGNLINLCCHLKLDLSGYDFSGLTIRHGYLQHVNLNWVNFTGADLSKSVFMQTFGYILSAALSPDGERLAIGDGTGQVRLWQTSDGQPLNTLQQGYTSWIWSVAWNPDGDRLASGGVDQLVRLWDPDTGDCLQTLQGHTNWVRSVAWHPDGLILASGSTDRTIKLWNPLTGDCIKTLQRDGDAVWSIAWSPDGTQLASVGIDQVVRVWDVQTAEYIHTLKGHTHWLRAVAWSPDGDKIASAGDDQTIRIWDAASGECLAVLQGHHAPIWSLSWDPDSQKIASASHDKTVKIWDIESQQCVKNLQEHTNWVWGVDWSSDNECLISVSHDRAIKLWDVATWSCLRTVEGYTSVAMSVAWSPDGQTLAGSCDDQIVRLWDIQSGKLVKSLKGHGNVVWGITWHPEGEMLASSCDDFTVRLWESSTGQCIKILQHSNWVWGVDWSPLGDQIATCSQDYVVSLWDIKTGDKLHVFEGHSDSIWCVVWSPDGKLLATACDDQTVRIWDVAKRECMQVLQHDHSVRSVSWSPNSQYLASGSADSIVRIWDVSRGHCCQELSGHENSLWSVAWNPMGKLLASGGDDLMVKVWNVDTGMCIETLQAHSSQIWSVAWSADGRTLASSSADKTIQLWDIRTGEKLKLLRADRPYEGMDITGVSGITEEQKVTLKALGAIERPVTKDSH